MAKYEIYVCLTEKPNIDELNKIGLRLCEKYGGLTIIPNCRGLWINDNTKQIESDKVEIWRLLTDKVILPSEIIELGEQLKRICKQKLQLITCNDVAYFV